MYLFRQNGLMMIGKKIRVLIVEDSAYMAKVLQSIISSVPELEVVGTARDGREGIKQAEALRPDVITMDINMPHVDGLQATEVIMSTNPRPIVIVSSESREGAAPTVRALGLGAIDFVAKPSSAVDLDMNSVRDELCRKLKMAAKVPVVRTASRSAATRNLGCTDASPLTVLPAAACTAKQPAAKPRVQAPLSPAFSSVPPANGRFPVVCLAASTGGPATLMRLIPDFPGNFPGAVLLIQHMPGAFSAQFVEQLAEVSALRVKEAEQFELLAPGKIYVCPGSHHLQLSSTGRISLDDGERVEGYRPSMDLALTSLATFAGPLSTAVVLTGMGSDAVKGALAIKASGGHVVAQDEASSVIFGMAAEAIRAGAVDQVVPLDQIYTAIEKRILYTFGAQKVGVL